MKTKNFITLVFIYFQFICLTMVAQTEVKGPYFGQTPPGTTPELFAPGILTVPGGLVAVSRIAFSPDGNECFFSGPVDWNFSSTRMYHTKCIDSVWTDHELVSFFPGYSCRQPFFTADGDTLYFCSDKNGTGDIWKVTRTAEGWGTPQVLPDPVNDSSSYDGMYTLATDGTAYIESMRSGGKGGIDVWRISKQQSGQPLKVENIGLPVNTGADNNDPFISPNGKYMILGSNYNDLYVSFSKEDGGWTALVNLNEFCPGANTGAGQEYAPYVTANGKYLFFNRIYTGELYWVSTLNIDSMKNINFPPYLMESIPDQTAVKGSMFYYQIPDSIFIDDNGNNTLTYTASLSNGDPIPQKLVDFDPDNRIFSGIPDTAGSFIIKVTVTDTAGASVSDVFKITVQYPENAQAFSLPEFKIYPNPTTGLVNISLGKTLHRQVVAELFDAGGKLLLKEDLSNKESISLDLTGSPKGIYLLKLSINENIVMNKFCLE